MVSDRTELRWGERCMVIEGLPHPPVMMVANRAEGAEGAGAAGGAVAAGTAPTNGAGGAGKSGEGLVAGGSAPMNSE